MNDKPPQLPPKDPKEVRERTDDKGRDDLAKYSKASVNERRMRARPKK
jgi:hypothetical protein